MPESLLTFFDRHLPLSEPERALVRELVPVRKVAAQALLLQEGEVSTEFYFIISGSIRLFYQVDGEEKTAFFYLKEMFVSAYESFTKQKPARHSLQAIEETEVAVISQETAMALLAASTTFEGLARVMMEEELIVYQDMIASFITRNAEQRYQLLLEEQPTLAQKVPQYHLASYLGVTPETLSRIRKRLAQKGLS